MRQFSALLLVVTVASLLTSSLASANEGADLEARVAARRDLEWAKMELRHFWQVEYPRQERQLNSAIELTGIEVRNLRDRLRSYESYSRFNSGSSFSLAIQNQQLCLREAELRLRDLWAERNALVRYKSDQRRALEMRVQEARMRVAALEPAPEPIVSPVVNQPAI